MGNNATIPPELTGSVQTVLQSLYQQATGTLSNAPGLTQGVATFENQLYALLDQAYENTTTTDSLT